MEVEACAAGVLEIAAWNQANAIRQVTVKRGLDVRDFDLCAFGGSGPLTACRLIDILGLRAAFVPRDPGNLSAFGLLATDLRCDHVQTLVRRHDQVDVGELGREYARLEDEALDDLARQGHGGACARAADLRYFGQAFEIQVPAPDGTIDAGFVEEVEARFHDAHERSYGYCYRDEERQVVEWVNLRVTGVGAMERPSLVPLRATDGPPTPDTTRAVFFGDRRHDTPVHARERLGAGDEVAGPAVIEEFGSTLPIHPGFVARDGPRWERGDPPAMTLVAADPVLVEIVQGTLGSIEAEVEDAIGRTARSPMIRDQHDFRAGIHDRRLRKLTGRSYSALVHPVVRDFPLESMRPGDVYFHNDVYESEGGIGHLPDLCVTVPVFCDGEVVAFVQAFGHHDDIGGMVPGSMPSHATSAFQEGLMVPPVKLFDAGVPNEAVLRIVARNSRMPESLAGDIDAECAATRMGAARVEELFERYGRAAVEACFDAIIANTTETFRREVLAKIPDGVYEWEDYAEHDGIDPPRLHAQRMTLTKREDRLTIDFAGTDPQAKGPINHAGDYADGNFLKKWIAPILRNLADTPERMAELDVNEGVVELIDMRFPPPGTLLTPVFPAPTNARTFVILRLLGVFAGALAQAVGGRMPADQETIRYTGITGRDASGTQAASRPGTGEWYLYREILGGGSGGRYYADGSDTIHIVPDSKNLPAEFVESRYPVRVEHLGLRVDSGGPGEFRGGLGYRKDIRVLEDASFMSIADRSILSCWGVKGGRAGLPFRVTIDPGGPDERVLPGLCDDEPIRAGEIVRIETTGGGGWGDPLDRDPERVAVDVLQGKVSPRPRAPTTASCSTRTVASTLRGHRAARAPSCAQRRGAPAFFDRGPGYERLARATPRHTA